MSYMSADTPECAKMKHLKKSFRGIEVINENSIDKFIKEVSDADIHSKLEPNLNTDPNHNYEILVKHLQLAKNKHIQILTITMRF